MISPRILYEDNHLLVVVKPAGFLSQADGSGAPDLLTYFRADLKRRYNKPGEVYLGLVHRLDRPVSGVMVLAKTSKAAARLSDQIRRGIVRKTYRACVLNPETLPPSARLEDYLIKDSRLNRSCVVSAEQNGAKYAALSYRTLQVKQDFAEVEINLETGRPHQIRVQFASRGHALLYDHRYGQNQGRGDLALFACSLSFEHPTRQEPLTFSVDPPPSWPARG